MVGDDPSWSMMSDCPLRPGTLQKHSPVQIMVFPVVVMDKTGTDCGERTGRTPDDRCPGQAREQGILSWAVGEFCSASLPCVSQQSALVPIQNPIVNHSTRRTAISVVSSWPRWWLPKLPHALPAVHPPPASLSSLHKPERPSRGLLSALSSPCLTAPIIVDSSSTSLLVTVFSPSLIHSLYIFFPGLLYCLPILE